MPNSETISTGDGAGEGTVEMLSCYKSGWFNFS